MCEKLPRWRGRDDTMRAGGSLLADQTFEQLAQTIRLDLSGQFGTRRVGGRDRLLGSAGSLICSTTSCSRCLRTASRSQRTHGVPRTHHCPPPTHTPLSASYEHTTVRLQRAHHCLHSAQATSVQVCGLDPSKSADHGKNPQ